MQCACSTFSLAHRHDVLEIIIKLGSIVNQTFREVNTELCAHDYKGGDSINTFTLDKNVQVLWTSFPTCLL